MSLRRRIGDYGTATMHEVQIDRETLLNLVEIRALGKAIVAVVPQPAPHQLIGWIPSKRTLDTEVHGQ